MSLFRRRRSAERPIFEPNSVDAYAATILGVLHRARIPAHEIVAYMLTELPAHIHGRDARDDLLLRGLYWTDDLERRARMKTRIIEMLEDMDMDVQAHLKKFDGE